MDIADKAAEIEVSIRAPAWGATLRTILKILFPRFQFALPHGERPMRRYPVAVPNLFQFALPHGERHAVILFSHFLYWFQFALPHGERQHPDAQMRAEGIVSIRAPAWGATRAGHRRPGRDEVSIRAPAWGAT